MTNYTVCHKIYTMKVTDNFTHLFMSDTAFHKKFQVGLEFLVIMCLSVTGAEINYRSELDLYI